MKCTQYYISGSLRLKKCIRVLHCVCLYLEFIQEKIHIESELRWRFYSDRNTSRCKKKSASLFFRDDLYRVELDIVVGDEMFYSKVRPLTMRQWNSTFYKGHTHDSEHMHVRVCVCS